VVVQAAEKSSGVNWTAVGAIAACFAALFTLLLVGVAWRQLGHLRKSTDAQVAVGLFKSFYEPSVRETLRLIYRTRPGDIKNLPRSELDEVEKEINWLDMVGHLLCRRSIDEHLAIRAFGGHTAVRCRYQLREYLAEVREERGGYYGKGLDYFASRALIFQIVNTPKNEWIRFCPTYRRGPADRGDVNLIGEEMEHPELLSRCELRKALACRRLRSIWRKELRQELSRDKELTGALF